MPRTLNAALTKTLQIVLNQRPIMVNDFSKYQRGSKGFLIFLQSSHKQQYAFTSVESTIQSNLLTLCRVGRHTILCRTDYVAVEVH